MVAVDVTVPNVHDTDELDQLYRAHVPGAQRFAYLLCGDRGIAEDAVHDAFVSVALSRRRRHIESFNLYFKAAVRNAVLSRLRSLERDAQRSARYAGDPKESAEIESPSTDLTQALLELPERQRAVIICRYWLDLSTADTATVLGCRAGTVKSTLARALEQLRTSYFSTTEGADE